MKREKNDFVMPLESPEVKGGWTIAVPPPANWEWCFSGDWHVTFRAYHPNPPNWLQRWLLRVLMDIHWRRIG